MRPWDNHPQIDRRLLEIQYSEPHRDYHNIDHPQLVFNYCVELHQSLAWKPSEYDTMFYADVAAWHDAVYQIGSKTNELDSSEMWRSSRRAERLTQEYVDDVASTINASASHCARCNGALTFNQKVFLDADLYELSGPWPVFQQNTNRVFNEFVTKFKRVDVCEGRLKWYESMLDTKQIYWLATHLEEKARENIQRAIEEMQCELSTG